MNSDSDIQEIRANNMEEEQEKRERSIPDTELGLSYDVHDEVPKRSLAKSIILVATCTLGMIVNVASSTLASIALPTIQRELDISDTRLNWVISGYPLSSGCLLLMFGRIADLYGRKKVYMLGSLWMLVFSLGSAFAQDDITLDVLRAFQGIGSAATIPASLGILAHAFPPSRARSIAFATFAAGAPVGGAFGNLLGGVLTQLTRQTWRSNFYLVAGMSAACCLGALLSFDKDLPSTEFDKRVDWVGAVLVTTGLVLIVFVLGEGESAPQKWATPYIIVLLILGVIFTTFFVLWDLYLEKVLDYRTSSPTSTIHLQTITQTVDLPPVSFSGQWAWVVNPPKWLLPALCSPLLRPSLWGRAHGKLGAAMVIAFLNWCSFMGFSYWVQLYYQNYEGYTPILTAVRLIPMFVTGISCNIFIALVVGHVPVVYLMTFGTLLTGCASLLFAVINTSSTYWAFGFPAAIICVVGADFVFASGTLFVAKVSMPHEQSTSGALFQTMTQLGTSVGITVGTVVFNRVQEKQLDQGENAAELLAYRAAHWVDFAFGMIATIISVLFLRGAGVVGGRKGN